MAGTKEKKPKSEIATDGNKKSSDSKEKKEKKGIKDKTSISKSDKKDKLKSSSSSATTDKKKGDKHKSSNGSAPLRHPQPRGPPPPSSDNGRDSYLADLDLPPSDTESDEEIDRRRPEDDEEQARHIAITSAKDSKKLAFKERKLLEKQAEAKAAALRDDDNVFDVSFEKQGDGGSTLSSTDIIVHNMTIRAKGKILLEHADVQIAAGRRYGLVGPNGKGKSTLLRMIARRQIPVPENLDVLLVEQEVVGTDASALESVVAADMELMELRAEEAELNAKLGTLDLNESNASTAAAAGKEEDMDEGEMADRLTEIYERMREMGAASAEARASKILHGLGFTKDMQARSTNLFSGGWRMRISLARALYIQPTVLLLDEPTNHLDLRAVLWLEEYLTRWKKTLIVVSHDRDFLNSVTTDIIHLHDERLHYYRGNFAQFEEMYEQRRREVNKEFDKYQKQLKAAKKSGSKANADKVTKEAKTKANRKQKGGGGGVPTESSSSVAANLPRQWNDYTVTFDFPEPTDLGSASLLQLIDADFKYPGREDFGLNDLNIGIDMGSRVAIVGPNGAGKTTLMNLLAGDLNPTTGEQRKSHKLRIGRYAQHFVDALSFDETPVEYLMNKFPQSGLKPEDMRAKLGRFGLSGHHHLQPICKLSGGQKARVVFAAIALSDPHILLLDEPTNHLDMQSIDALADALEEFEGGVVIISHDSRLLSRVCDEEKSAVWIVDNGTIETYPGDFDDYKQELVKEIIDELNEDEEEEKKARGDGGVGGKK
jgi:ATP-binding cassette, subfamily F, member 1